jgi:uncharacterized repeat protein (TIGR03803 family)
MKTKFTSTKTRLTMLNNGSKTRTMTGPVPGRKPVLALIMRLVWAAVLVLPAFGAQAGVVLTTLHSFSGNDGAYPAAGLVQGSDGIFYGTTINGGTNGYGTVFKISTNGALTSLYSFTGTNDGASPWAGLVQGNDGNFYGTTRFGGTNNSGTVFQISSNGVLTSLYSFTGGTDGESPNGLVQGSDGNFYGTTAGTNSSYPFGGSGTNGWGTVFQITTNGALTTVYAFRPYYPYFEGANPAAGLVQASDGNFYGTTQYGGGSGYGTVFQITTNGMLTTLYSFGGSRPYDAEAPVAGLVQGSDGNLYGTTFAGGRLAPSGYGTMFRVSTNGTYDTSYTSLYVFGGGADGRSPEAGLVQASDGNFYGTTHYGGYHNPGYGTVFEVGTNGALTTLYAFTGGTNDGANSSAGLVQGRDGSFYGTSQRGGTNNLGTVFRMILMPGPPQLNLSPSETLTWPTYPGGFNLEFATNLVSPIVWQTTNAPFSYTFIIGNQNAVTIPITGSQMFFRLSR